MESTAENGLKPVPVIAVVMVKEKACLLCKRQTHKRHGDLWEFPGGKIKKGESLEDAARREVKEELGVELIVIRDLLGTIRDPHSPYLIHFVEADISGEPKALEHQEIGWFKANDLQNLPLAPADAAFIRKRILGRR